MFWLGTCVSGYSSLVETPVAPQGYIYRQLPSIMSTSKEYCDPIRCTCPLKKASPGSPAQPKRSIGAQAFFDLFCYVPIRALSEDDLGSELIVVWINTVVALVCSDQSQDDSRTRHALYRFGGPFPCNRY